MVWQWYIDGALISQAIIIGIICFYIWFHITKQEHRKMMFEVTMFFCKLIKFQISQKNTLRAKGLEKARKSHGMNIEIEIKNIWSWTNVLFWEKFGITGGKWVFLKGFLYLILVILLNAYLVPIRKQGILLYFCGFVCVYYCPLLFRTTMLYPLSRRELVRVHFLTSLLELGIVLLGYCMYGFGFSA